MKSSRNTRLKLPLLALLEEDFTEELLSEERADDVDATEDERNDDDELRNDDDELRGVDDETAVLVLVPVALKAAIDGVPEPFAQKPKLTAPLAAMLLFQARGVTTLPDRVPFHKLLIWVPAVFRVTVQLVTAVLPAFMST